MSRSGEVVLDFGSEERTFRLGISEWRKIQERCDAGPPELLGRLAPLVRAVHAGLSFSQLLAGNMLGSWRIDDIREVLVQGLIGGGMTAVEAGALVRAEFDERPVMKYVAHAFIIMERSLAAPEDEPLGESKAGARKKAKRPPSRAAKSASQASMASAQ